MVCALKQQGIQPKTIIDVGANVGQFAIAAAKLFSPVTQIYSFEPYPEVVELLQQNVHHLKNITIYPLALGKNEGEIAFHVNTHSHSSSILPLAEAHRDAFPYAQEVKTITVTLSTLDKIFSMVMLEPPILLKLDVQGYEATTLQGGMETLQRVNYVVVETSFKPLYEGEVLFMDIVRLMAEHHFRFLCPIGWLSNPENGEILQMDALFVQP
jgi:FkbM family methyltransferase